MRTSLLFYEGHALSSRVIEAVEHGRFSHVAGRVLDGGSDLVYEAVMPRVQVRNWSVRLDGGAVEIPCDLDVDFLRAQVGKPYDIRALLCDAACHVLPRGIGLADFDEDAWDCSRLMARAGRMDISHLTGPPTPADVYRIAMENLKINAEK